MKNFKENNTKSKISYEEYYSRCKTCPCVSLEKGDLFCDVAKKPCSAIAADDCPEAI